MLLPLVVLLSAALAVSLVPRRFRLPLWSLAIICVVVPWTRFMGHTHWERVQWIPFVPPPEFRLRDVVANVAMYMPFGWFMTRGRDGWPRLTTVVAAAAALSIATEYTQVFSHGRFPTATDVLMNVTGAGLGAWLARRQPPARRAAHAPAGDRGPSSGRKGSGTPV